MAALMRFACLGLLMTGLPLPAGAQNSRETCVEAQVGTDRAYNCMNDALAQLARNAHSARAMNTLDATSPAPAVGTFNRTATAERMGNTFGRSVLPQRPPPPVFAAPFATAPAAR